MSNQVVTRFAPSPTGYLHIGGARTALFNWLYARGRGGKFLLRIEDTDRARHNEAAVAAIIEGLTWLGIDWDGAPISQFAQQDRHIDVADQLLAKGAAYRCYMNAEEIETARNAARTNKTRFESPWRDSSKAAPSDLPFTIRFKAPQSGDTIVQDKVQGKVTFPNAALDDLIIIRSDGAATYNLAVVVDDHDMGVTHIVRGDDHLNNAARQTQIYHAMDWPTPTFAHAPLIHGSDGAKLSKRHGALGVEAYRDQGFLAEGLANYLIRLGWSHGNDEIIPVEKALNWFDIADINKAPSRLDLDKLAFINKHYLKSLSDEELISKASSFFKTAGITVTPDVKEKLLRGAPFLKDRSSTLADIPSAAKFITAQRPLEISGKAAKPLRKDGALEILQEATSILNNDINWTAENLDATITKMADSKGVGFGTIGAPMRAALTAGAPSPGLGDLLFILGQQESLERLSDAKL